jgi:murein DD-endopeptidase MepM/ murein hydrolase activator NlpD
VSSILLVALLSLAPAEVHSEIETHGPFAPIGADVPPPACVPPELYESLRAEHESRAPKGVDGAARSSLFPLFDWPMENAVNDDLILVNYVDHDTSTAIVEYMGMDHAYDGHRGTDISMLSFRHMDRGLRLLSGAPGTVAAVEYSNTDRNYQAPYDPANYVIMDNGDGSYTAYYHLRRNAVTVNVGESVQQGQVIGLTGSSGNSTDAHLHIEFYEFNPSYTVRDPWNGPNNPVPSLWNAQEPYAGDDTIHIQDMGVTTEAAAGGDLTGVPVIYFKERLSQPAVMGIDEPFLAAWIQVQANAATYRIQIRKPDGTVFASTLNSTGKIRYGWFYWFWDFAGMVTAADYGTWSMRFRVGGVTIKEIFFEVGPTTEFGPRFSPIDGRSFRVDGTVQRDTMRVSDLGDPVLFSLIDAPGFVSLVGDSIVTVAAASTQSTRSLYFRGMAVDGAGRADTIWYHVVDPSKPLEPPVGVAAEWAQGGAWLSQNAPNPFNPSTTIRFDVSAPGPAHLRVYDTSGRLVRTLVDARLAPAAEGHVAVWDGRTDAGTPAASGVYVYRLVTPSARASRTMVLVR